MITTRYFEVLNIGHAEAARVSKVGEVPYTTATEGYVQRAQMMTHINITMSIHFTSKYNVCARV